MNLWGVYENSMAVPSDEYLDFCVHVVGVSHRYNSRCSDMDKAQCVRDLMRVARGVSEIPGFDIKRCEDILSSHPRTMSSVHKMLSVPPPYLRPLPIPPYPPPRARLLPE